MRSVIPAGEPARVLAGVPLFAGLDRVALAKLAAHFERVRFEAGEIVFREGDPGDAFYVVLDGTFSDSVGAPDTGVDRRLATRGPGSTFGDVALLESTPLDDRASRRGGRRAPARARTLPRARRAGPPWRSQSRRRSASVWRANVRSVHTVRLRRCCRATAPPWTPTRRRVRAAASAAVRVGRAVGGALALAISASWLMPPPAGSPAGWFALGTLGAMVPALALVLPEGLLALAAIALDMAGVAPRGRPGRVRHAELGARRGGALLRWVWPRSGLVYRIALAVVARARGGFGGRPPRSRWQAWRSARGAERDRPRRLAGAGARGADRGARLRRAPARRQACAGGYRPLRPDGRRLPDGSTTAVLARRARPVRAGTGWVGWWAISPRRQPPLLALGALLWLYRPRAGTPGPRRRNRPCCRCSAPARAPVGGQRVCLATGSPRAGLRHPAPPWDRSGVAGGARARGARGGGPGDGGRFAA